MSVYPIYAVAKRAQGSIPLKWENIFSYRLCFSPFRSKERGKDGRLFGRPDREKAISFSRQPALFVTIPLLDQEYCGKIIGESEPFQVLSCKVIHYSLPLPACMYVTISLQ